MYTRNQTKSESKDARKDERNKEDTALQSTHGISNETILHLISNFRRNVFVFPTSYLPVLQCNEYLFRCFGVFDVQYGITYSQVNEEKEGKVGKKERKERKRTYLG